MTARPPFIRHYSDLPAIRDSYPGESELTGEDAPLSRPLGLERLGIHHLTLPPGERSSWPHAEEKEEEFTFVLEGAPDVWIDGVLHRLRPGDAVAFLPGTGIAHTVINNTDAPVRLLVVGERIPGSRILYPGRPWGFQGMKPELVWDDAPARERGGHDGLPDVGRRPT